MRRAFITLLLSIAAHSQTANPPRVFLLDAKQLQHERLMVASNSIQPDEFLKAALAEADKAMTVGPLSVMDKKSVPPSGDKHDYMSLAPYFWPNPNTPNHLPYVRRDGERNPEIRDISDHDEMGKMASVVRALALGYYLTGNENYAARAALLLRTWFLDPATRMNPNLEYAQGIRGVTTGRGIGIIDCAGLPQVIDAAGLLADSKSWTSADADGLKNWFGHFLEWLQTSKNGKDESAAKNNHGSFYDMQVVDYALFLDKRELAENIVMSAEQKRIATQIEPDGRQPLELARTKSFSYSAFNLRALTELATLADRVAIDLWGYETSDGRSIRRALDFLIPYGLGEKSWPYKQIEPIKGSDLAGPLLDAATVFKNKEYAADAKRLSEGTRDVNVLLLEAAAK